MEKYLNILESEPAPETINEEKVRFISSKVPIYNFFGMNKAYYSGLSIAEKSKMFREYYFKLCDKYYASCKILFSFLSGFWPFFLVEYYIFVVVLCLAGNGSCNTQIDSGISQAIQNSSKISLSKNIFSDNRI